MAEVSDDLGKHFSVYSGVGFKVKHAKDIVRECLHSFPYLWVSVVRVLIIVDTSQWLMLPNL